MSNGKNCNKEKMVFLVAEKKRRQVHYTISYLIEVKERE
jgi:hypothetical protein